jgi:hypothetical protein
MLVISTSCAKRSTVKSGIRRRCTAEVARPSSTLPNTSLGQLTAPERGAKQLHSIVLSTCTARRLNGMEL